MVSASWASVSRSSQPGAPSRAMMPLVGLSPYRPVKAAGMRAEPPPSEAVASGVMPAAMAAAEPPLEPPGDHSAAHGFTVSPYKRFAVNPSKQNSGTLVLPMGMAPAARNRTTPRLSRRAEAHRPAAASLGWWADRPGPGRP